MGKTEDRLSCGCLLTVLVAFLLGIAGLFWMHEGSRGPWNCVGLDDDAKRVKGVEYEISTRNVIVGIIGVETLVIPAYVALTSIYCPVQK